MNLLTTIAELAVTTTKGTPIKVVLKSSSVGLLYRFVSMNGVESQFTEIREISPDGFGPSQEMLASGATHCVYSEFGYAALTTETAQQIEAAIAAAKNDAEAMQNAGDTAAAALVRQTSKTRRVLLRHDDRYLLTEVAQRPGEEPFWSMFRGAKQVILTDDQAPLVDLIVRDGDEVLMIFDRAWTLPDGVAIEDLA